MTGSNEENAVQARRKKVLEYTGQGFSQASMSRILNVSERTIERDVRAVMGEIRAEREQIRKDFVEARIAGHRKRADMIASEITKSQNDPRQLARWMKLQQEEEAMYTEWMQQFGEAPKVAERVDMTQRVENPFEGIRKKYAGLDGKGATDRPE